MKITPLDVGNHRFPQRWRGYDPKEVEIFLEMVSQEMEELVQENRFLTKEFTRASADLSEHKEKETLLKDAMITAQRMAEDMKNNMVKEAQAIVAQAELESDAILRRAHERVIDIQDDIQELKDQRVRVREEVRSVINTHTALLEAGEQQEAVKLSEEIEGNLMIMRPRKREAVID
jgi:cell division initiation protein